VVGSRADGLARRLRGVDIAAGRAGSILGLARLCRLLSAGLLFPAAPERRFHRGCRGDSMPRIIVDELSVDVLQASKDIKPRFARGPAHFGAYPAVALFAQPYFFVHCSLH